MRGALAIALLCAGLARADARVGGGLVAVGGGAGYELLGADVGLALGPAEAFVGLGMGTLLSGGVMGGLRLLRTLRPRRWLFVTLQGGHLIARADDLLGEDAYELGLLGGFRAMSSGGVFVEFGAGLALRFERWSGPRRLVIAPDVDLGVGVRF